MDETIASYNVQHFADLVRRSANPLKRSLAMRLLIEEEDKLGASRQALDVAEMHVVKGRQLIENQRALIARMQGNGHDVRPHNDHLRRLIQVQAAFESYRRTIMRRSNDGAI